ncbi:MAG: STT3 domain-containing protein [Candidatus Hodarchaeota archaeon]
MPRIVTKITDNLKDRYEFARSNISRTTILHHSALVLVFIISLIVRIYPFFKYEIKLKAFDPFSQLKAARYIEANGLLTFFDWTDPHSWYPWGRNWGSSQFIGTPLSSVLLHLLLKALGINVNLETVAYFVPAILGALSVLGIYFLGKEVGNKRVGLFAAFFLSVSPAHLQRSMAGFYDNEALGIFLLILAFYFFMRSLRTSSIFAGAISGIFIGLLSMSWGAFLYPMQLLSLFAVVLGVIKLFTGADVKRLFMTLSTSLPIGYFFAILDPRNGAEFVFSTNGLIPLGAMGFIALIAFYQYYSNVFAQREQFQRSVYYAAVIGVIIVAIAATVFLVTGGFQLIGSKFISTMLPMFRSDTPILKSVSEHLILSWSNLFLNIYVLVFLIPVGIIYAYQNPTERNIFTLVFAITALYFAGSMVRLLLLLAPAAALIAAKAADETLLSFSLAFQDKFTLSKRRAKVFSHIGNEHVAVAYGTVGFLMLLFLIHGLAIAGQQLAPPDILVAFPISEGGLVKYGDWQEALMWLSVNAETSDIVASWWDYGYWITVNSNVTTLVDNATINSTQIGNVGAMMMSEPNVAYQIADYYDVTYILVNLAAGYTYLGSDLGKSIWMIRIAERNSDLVDLDSKDYYYDEYSLPAKNRGLYHGAYFASLLWIMATFGLEGTQTANLIKNYGPLKLQTGFAVELPAWLEHAYDTSNDWVRIYKVNYDLI